jgi:NADPH-dependent glutamate synthase beta subunit-like oxidoreductase
MSDDAYAIAIIGGATAGAEAAGIFARSGILTVVFEQNARPYGKVEDGLPRWHVKLRRKEYGTIDQKLGSPGVHYVPNTAIGRDVDLQQLIHDWGFHAVVLANGAWRDRPLPIEGADAYVGKGLVYQNPFIYWFNHYNEASYDGPQFEILDGTIVVGGGLASIDVVKVIQLELCVRAVRERGVELTWSSSRWPVFPRRWRPTTWHGRTSASKAARSTTGGAKKTCRSSSSPTVRPTRSARGSPGAAPPCSRRPGRSTCSRSSRCVRPWT